jgi:hypothetical protein
MTVTTNKVLKYPDEYATLNQTPMVTQTDILRSYLMERRRALLTELRSIESVLGIQTERVTR